ncbi:MAG: hypothetical protein FJY55_07950 [Betaproteobacteria bacterium]|nr:hypothetical protein [Betaproteobacteria bacterium]
MTDSDSGLVAWTHVIYGLHAISVLTGSLTSVTIVSAFVFGWPSIIAVILNYLKRDEATGSFLATHFRWQIRTFWFALGWSVLSAALFITLVGIPLAMALILGVSIWVAYRVIRGWMALFEGKPMRFADDAPATAMQGDS